MATISDTQQWLDKNINVAYSIIRIFLGIALLVRGVIMISDPMSITKLTGANQYYWWYSYVIIAHISGGLSLAFGIFTRLGAFLQIPVLAGAVFIVHLKQGLLSVGQSLELSVLVLVLLIVYFIFGSGAIAIDSYVKRRNLADANT